MNNEDEIVQPNRPETFLDRLNYEKDDLESKVNKLNDFLNSDKIDGVSILQKRLLTIQLNSMNTYLSILKIRIIDLIGN